MEVKKMKDVRNIRLYCLLGLCVLALLGCGKKADENKPISGVKAEAEKMSVAELRSMALKYKEAIMAKQGDVEKIMSKLKEVPLTKKLGEEAVGLKADIDNVNKSISALMERFDIYYNKIKEKGGDLSGLKI
jgi:nitrogen regulatory protein PII